MDKEAYAAGAEQALFEAGIIKEAMRPGPGQSVSAIEYMLAKMKQMAGKAKYKMKGYGQDISEAIGGIPGKIKGAVGPGSDAALAAEWHAKKLLQELKRQGVRAGRAVKESPATLPVAAGVGGLGAGYGLSELLDSGE